MLSTQEILASVGTFSSHDLLLFEEKALRKIVEKNDVVLGPGEICQSVYFILSGSFFQFLSDHETEKIIDLHLTNEWMFNHPSLIGQIPSGTTIKAFEDAEVIELSLINLHELIARSQSFLSLGRVFDQAHHRTYLFDNALSLFKNIIILKMQSRTLYRFFRLK